MSQDILVLQKNLEALKERFPIVAQVINDAKFPKNRKVIEGTNGLPVYQVLYNEKFINLTSKYNPISEAKTQILNRNIESSDIIFIFGEAGLYHVEETLAAATEHQKIVLISVNPTNLKLVFASRDLSLLLKDERLFIGVALDEKGIRSIMDRILRGDVYRVYPFTWIVHPVESKVESGNISLLEKCLHSIVQSTLLNFNTTAFFEKSWTENFLYNIPRLLSGVPVKNFGDSWREKPVIIVGAGPSLNKNIELLRDFKGKAIILCTDTAYRALQAHCIKPTAIVTIDGGTANLRNMNDCNYEDIPVIMDIYTHWGIADGSGIPPAVFVSNDLHMEWWKKISLNPETPFRIATGASVATTAFSFARHIGANPIILVGEDLSYPNGEVYASGTVNEKKTLDEVRNERTLYPVTDVHGNTLYTTVDYLYYLRWFEDVAKDIKNRCINATEGGALHKGFIIQTLAETLDKDCSEPLPVSEWSERFQWEFPGTTYVNSVLHQIKRSVIELRAYSRVLNILVHTTEKLLEAVQQDDIVMASNCNLVLERGRAILEKMELASAFLDSYSFKTVREDIGLADQLQQDDAEVTPEEHIVRSTRQSLKLFRELIVRCNESVEMHKGSLDRFKKWFNMV